MTPKNPESFQKVQQLIKSGVPLMDAVKQAGMVYSTYHRWKGKKHKTLPITRSKKLVVKRGPAFIEEQRAALPSGQVFIVMGNAQTVTEIFQALKG